MPKKATKKQTKKEKPVLRKTENKNLASKADKENKEKKKKYYEAVGRRKTSTAIVRLFTSSPEESVEKGNLIVNNKNYTEYFPTIELQKIVEAPFRKLKSLNRFRATVKVKGGGIKGQAEAVRHGLARALVLFDSNFRKKLKKAGYLTRDPRKKERKKFGLKKARRAPQWSKR